ncbi:MAG: ABC transporter ATP-binding protein [Bacteroidetes bacterium]|nr:ABC transporter ATP-binding protein [Bacteroidota bacterium]
MIEVKGISKKFGNIDVLKDVNLTIQSNEIVAITGASGAGKSTLLHIMGTLMKPDRGEITIEGKNILKLRGNKLSDFRNKTIGFIFQFHQLLPEFSALENASLPALIKGKSKKEAFAEAEKLLEYLGVNHRKENKPAQLSGGEQQRVAVARALINKPSVIFADEPSGNLDSKNAAELHQLFFDLRRDFGQTFVIVTHNEILAKQSDRSIQMKDGIILQ